MGGLFLKRFHCDLSRCAFGLRSGSRSLSRFRSNGSRFGSRRNNGSGGSSVRRGCRGGIFDYGDFFGSFQELIFLFGTGHEEVNPQNKAKNDNEDGEKEGDFQPLVAAACALGVVIISSYCSCFSYISYFRLFLDRSANFV